MKILVVEDDASISGPLYDGLTREGFDVEIAATGTEALAAAPADLVLLDLGLPDLEGSVVCQRIREATNTPIIVVSARGEEIDRVILLELGADDYVVKPFGLRELVARIRAVARRTNAHTDASAQASSIVAGALSIDQRKRNVEFAGRPIELTPKEYDLLLYLASDLGAVRSRDQIIHDVWDEHWWGSTKTLDVHVASLRKKLHPDVIETIRSVGYRLVELPDPGE